MIVMPEGAPEVGGEPMTQPPGEEKRERVREKIPLS